jgi:hypothetical protein
VSDRVYLTSTEVLAALRSAFTSFDEGASNALASIDSEIGETRTWLLERKTHWQREVAQAEQELSSAEDNLRTCEASGYYDDEGDYVEPDCTSEASAVTDAQNRLTVVTAKLDNVNEWALRIESGVEEFHRSAGMFATAVTHQAQERQRFLASKIEQYAAAITLVSRKSELLRPSASSGSLAPRTTFPEVHHIACLVDPAKLATLGARGLNPRIQKIVYWLETARRAGQKPGTVLDGALSQGRIISPEAAKLTKDALLRNLTIAERLGCFTGAGLEEMRRGVSPTIQRGPYKGDRLSVDHIIPRSICPELDNVIPNLELMPLKMNMSKAAKIGQRQVDTACRLNRAGLLSDQGLKAIETASPAQQTVVAER